MDQPSPVIRQMIAEAIETLGGEVTNSEIRSYIHGHWTGVNDQSINAHIKLLTVNAGSRINWPENQKERISNDKRYDWIFR